MKLLAMRLRAWLKDVAPGGWFDLLAILLSLAAVVWIWAATVR